MPNEYQKADVHQTVSLGNRLWMFTPHIIVPYCQWDGCNNPTDPTHHVFCTDHGDEFRDFQRSLPFWKKGWWEGLSEEEVAEELLKQSIPAGRCLLYTRFSLGGKEDTPGHINPILSWPGGPSRSKKEIVTRVTAAYHTGRSLKEFPSNIWQVEHCCPGGPVSFCVEGTHSNFARAGHGGNQRATSKDSHGITEYHREWCRQRYAQGDVTMLQVWEEFCKTFRDELTKLPAFSTVKAWIIGSSAVVKSRTTKNLSDEQRARVIQLHTENPDLSYRRISELAEKERIFLATRTVSDILRRHRDQNA